MPEWLKEIVLYVLGSASLTGGVGWWVKSRRDDRIAREARQQAIVERLETKNEALWGKVESLLADAAAHERENTVLRAERIVVDKQLAALATAMTAALERSEAANAKLRMLGDGR